MNYCNVLGFILLFIFIIQLFSGLLLSSYYEDYVIISFDSVVYIMYDVIFG